MMLGFVDPWVLLRRGRPIWRLSLSSHLLLPTQDTTGNVYTIWTWSWMGKTTSAHEGWGSLLHAASTLPDQ